MFTPNKFIGQGTITERAKDGQMLVVLDKPFIQNKSYWVIANYREIGTRVNVYFGKTAYGAGPIIEDLK